jgi:hypothetical protein
MSDRDMVRLEVHLDTGATFTVDCSDYSYKKNGAGELTELNWVTPAGFDRKLISLHLSRVVAMVQIDADVTP